MPKRRLTPAFVFFYFLFWPDTWRIIAGLILGGILVPLIMGTGQAITQTAMVFIMLAAIGYAVSAKPARAISLGLRRAILKN